MASGSSIYLSDNEESSPLSSKPPDDLFSDATGSSMTAASSTSATLSSAINKKRKCEPHKAKTTWDHFRRAQGNELDRATDGQRLWYCQMCKNPSWATQVSSNARKHLEKPHHIIVDVEPSKGKKAHHDQLKDIFARASVQKIEKIENQEQQILECAINKEVFNEALVQLITGYNLLYNAVE